MAISKLGPNLALSLTHRDKRWSRALICLLKSSHQVTNESHSNRIRRPWESIIRSSAELRLVRILKREKAPQTQVTITLAQWATNSQLLRSATDKKRPHRVWKRPHLCRPQRNLALMWWILRKVRKETESILKRSKVLAMMKLLKLWDFFSKWKLKKAKRLANVVSQDMRNSKRRMSGMHLRVEKMISIR